MRNRAHMKENGAACRSQLPVCHFLGAFSLFSALSSHCREIARPAQWPSLPHPHLDLSLSNFYPVLSNPFAFPWVSAPNTPVVVCHLSTCMYAPLSPTPFHSRLYVIEVYSYILYSQ